MRLITVLLALCLLPNIAVAATESLAVYSSVCINEESGDLNGIRVAVHRLDDAPYLAMQWARGDSLGKPERKKLSSADLRKGNIAFDFEYQREPAPFAGTITEKAIVGTFGNKSLMKDYGWKTIRLRRVPLAQNKYSVCR